MDASGGDTQTARPGALRPSRRDSCSTSLLPPTQMERKLCSMPGCRWEVRLRKPSSSLGYFGPERFQGSRSCLQSLCLLFPSKMTLNTESRARLCWQDSTQIVSSIVLWFPVSEKNGVDQLELLFFLTLVITPPMLRSELGVVVRLGWPLVETPHMDVLQKL